MQHAIERHTGSVGCSYPPPPLPIPPEVGLEAGSLTRFRLLQDRLLGIYRATDELRQAGRIDQIVLAINRSDYMLDEPSGGLLQVGYGTVVGYRDGTEWQCAGNCVGLE